jgi:hypothetical protein
VDAARNCGEAIHIPDSRNPICSNRLTSRIFSPCLARKSDEESYDDTYDAWECPCRAHGVPTSSTGQPSETIGVLQRLQDLCTVSILFGHSLGKSARFLRTVKDLAVTAVEPEEAPSRQHEPQLVPANESERIRRDPPEATIAPIFPPDLFRRELGSEGTWLPAKLGLAEK